MKTTTFTIVILLAFANLNVNAQAFELPFFEDWQSWHFETNQWLTDGDNWQMDTQNGNDAPSAKFHRTPILTDYSSALTSNTFNASLLNVGRIFLNFDLKLTDNHETGTEFMHFQVFDGTNWIKLDSISNLGSFDWTAYSLEITNWAIGNNFQIRFLAKGENSMDMLDWHIDNIEVYRECDRPTDLVWEYYWNGDDDWGIELAWEAPESVFPWDGCVHYDSGENAGGIGTVSAPLFDVAIRWDAGDLLDYEGDTVKSIKYFVNSGFTFVVVCIWTGENADSLVYSDTAQNVVIGEWNEHFLNDTVIIDGTHEYWVGYHMQATGMGTYPLGHDEGPAVTGYSDKMKIDDGEWQNLSDFGPDFNVNWNIQMVLNPDPIQNPEALLGFNIYRFGCGIDDYLNIEFIEFEEEQESYIFHDTDIENCLDSVFCYKVNANWGIDGDTCSSDFASSLIFPWQDSVCIWPVGINEMKLNHGNSIGLYPNPATTTLNIKSESKLQTVSIFNLFGQKVKEFDAGNKKEVQIDVSKLKSGVYILKVFDGETTISSKFIIQ